MYETPIIYACMESPREYLLYIHNSVLSSENLMPTHHTMRGEWYIEHSALQWRHNGVSNHPPHDCLLNRLFRHRSKKTSKLCVTDLCAGNSPVTGEFPAQMASNAENISISWRHHVNRPNLNLKPHNLKRGFYYRPIYALVTTYTACSAVEFVPMHRNHLS